MNYAEKIKRAIKGNTYDIINAVIYARVSTENEGQKESCANQVALAKNYIMTHRNIILKGIFVDDGISGKDDYSRPDYNKMLQMIENENIDLIITKSLSRLNRNELKSLMLESLLIQNEATILTLEDNQVHDFEDLNAGLLHSINFAIDAQYVKRQSINGKKVHELRCQRKELSAKDIAFGYDWHRDTKTITINEEKAKVVRDIFDDYVFKGKVPAEIQRELERKGIKLTPHTIANIIKSEKYIGKFYINKKINKLGVGNMKSHRVILPKKDWILVERPDLKIVDEDIFNMAQELHSLRSRVYFKEKTTKEYFKGKHIFSSKIFCSMCGNPYRFRYSDRKGTNGIYTIVRHNCECVNKVQETDMINITRIALQKIVNQEEEICKELEDVLIKVIANTQNHKDELTELKKQKKKKENQLNNLTMALANGDFNGSGYQHISLKINEITEDIQHIEVNIEKITNNRLNKSFICDKIQEIRDAIATLKNFETIDRECVMNYIEKITTLPNGNIDLVLRTGGNFVFDGNFNEIVIDDESVVKNGNQDDQNLDRTTCPGLLSL
ncbi:MAG: recombinase family protein [Lachnospiraceae bacterium]|nr:recombinase family protein [Lachnospiraceae bacterium]